MLLAVGAALAGWRSLWRHPWTTETCDRHAERPGRAVELRTRYGDGALHTRIVADAGAELAAVDIVRVRDGRVAEHWDVVQPVPAPLPHPHGMF
jgi:predicted SnoaL-like aldol condensation-catalyzing enzyme